MRGHSLAPPAPCAFIPYLVRFSPCLLNRFAPLPAPRAVGHGVISALALRPAPRSVWRAARPSPLIASRSASLASVSRLLLPGSPSSWLSRIASRPAPLLPAHRPANRVEGAGRHRLACLPLSCEAERANGFSFSLSCGSSCLLGVRCRYRLKPSPEIF